MQKLPIKLSLILGISIALLAVVFWVGLMVDTSPAYADDGSASADSGAAPSDSGATDSGSVTATDETAPADDEITPDEAAVSAATEATILTDKPDYTPDQTPVISGAGFDPNSEVTITITAPDGTATTFTTTTDSQGQFTATYEGPLTKGEFTVAATDGVSTATTTFLDATVILYPTDDSWVDRRNPEQNYGSSPELHVMFWGPDGNNRRAYLMFDLAALPDTADTRVVIDSATLYLYRYRASIDVDNDPDIPAVYKTDDSWTESTITWNNQPGPGAFVADGSPSFGFGWISWNITGYVQDEYAGDKTLSVLLMFPSGWKHADFYSTEYSGITYDPYLAITYTTQYYLTVNSPYGTPGGEGWYNEGDTAYATVDPLTVPGSGGTYAFTNWSDDATGTTSPSDPITMDSPKTATATWTFTPTPTPPAFVTGGNIKGGRKVLWTFGGNVGYLGDGTLHGQFQIVDHASKESWHCHDDFNSLICWDDPTNSPPASVDHAQFIGTFTSNKGGEKYLRVTIWDDQEPGRDYDTILVEVSTDGGATWPTTWFSGNPISGGNFQVHEGYKG